MRSFLLATVLSVAFFSACDNVDNLADPLGIGYSEPATALTAAGSIDQQNAGPLVTYTVDEAAVLPLGSGEYVLRYKFTSGDSLRLVVVSRTKDYNYHSDQVAAQNELAYAIFNRDTLELKSSAVAIQPKPDQNRFSTVVNVHTVTHGDFNGTVNGVPMVH